MLAWNKISFLEYYTPPTDTAYILPRNEGIAIVYDGEQRIIENIGVQEFVEVLKTLETSPSFKTDFKSEVERVANHLILPQKHATT